MESENYAAVEDVRLNGHHIGLVKLIRRGGIKSYINRFIMNRLYGKEFTEKVYAWAEGLDDDTIVTVNDGDNPAVLHSSSKYERDSICEQGCPHMTECLSSSMGVRLKLQEEHPFLFLFFGLYEETTDRRELMSRDLKAGEPYRLEDIPRS